MVSGRAPANESDLATGTTAPSRARAAGQFWTFTMSNSGRKASTFAETMGFDATPRMHVTLTRIASRDARHHDRQRAQASASDRGRRACGGGENLVFRELFRTIWSLLPYRRRGFGPPPVIPVFLNPVRVDSAGLGSRSSRTQSRTRSTDNPVGRRRR